MSTANTSTLGQYLRPSLAHIPVDRCWIPPEFDQLVSIAGELGCTNWHSGHLVHNSYHADKFTRQT